MNRFAMSPALVLAVFVLNFPVEAVLRPVELRVEWLPDPHGLDSAKPRLSWRVESEACGAKQSAYRVIVASSEAALQNGHGKMWDSGKVPSEETLNIDYAGAPLTSGQQLFWKVQAWDANGKESRWSTPASWSMGLLQPADWKAQWISFRDPSPIHADRKTLQLPPTCH